MIFIKTWEFIVFIIAVIWLVYLSAAARININWNMMWKNWRLSKFIRSHINFPNYYFLGVNWNEINSILHFIADDANYLVVSFFFYQYSTKSLKRNNGLSIEIFNLMTWKTVSSFPFNSLETVIRNRDWFNRPYPKYAIKVHYYRHKLLSALPQTCPFRKEIKLSGWHDCNSHTAFKIITSLLKTLHI